MACGKALMSDEDWRLEHERVATVHEMGAFEV
jgi:hypothetical protein